jgi:hypothetical protein
MRDYPDTLGGADANGAIAALRSGIFDGQKLRCGHEVKTVPAKYYHAERVTARMW